MDTTKNIRNISNIFNKKTKYYNIKRYYSPILFNKRIKNFLLIGERQKIKKKSFDLKISKSNKNMEYNSTCLSKKNLKTNKVEKKDSFHKRKEIPKSPNCTKDNSRIINYIQKKITFQSFGLKITKKHSIDNILKNGYSKEKIITNFLNKTKNNSSPNSMTKNKYQRSNLKKNLLKNNCINKIYLFVNNKNLSSSNKNFKKRFFNSSKKSISLDNILSKTINQNQKMNQQKSFEKNKISSEKIKKIKNKFPMNILNRKNLKIVENGKTRSCKNSLYKNLIPKKINIEKNKKIIIEKNKKISRHIHHKQNENKISTQNLTEIIKSFAKNNLPNNNNKIIKNKKFLIPKKIIDYKDKNNNISKNKDKKKQENNKNKSKNEISHYKKYNELLNYSRDNSLISEECFNPLNEARIISENRSTNDKSLNAKKMEHSNKRKINATPKIFISKLNNSEKNYLYKNINNKNNIDNDEYLTCEFDIGNEQNNKINGVKTNNFDVKKPKEENLKFTFMKEDKESDISVSHASKIIIGNIDGYKDIIETDKKNYENIHSRCLTSLVNKKSYFFNNTNRLEEGLDDNTLNNNNNTKKISNLSTLLKKESEPITFSDCNFNESINMTNNFDGMSSTITGNINDNKNKQNSNYNNDNNIFYDGRKFNSEKKGNLNNISFSINLEKSLEDFSKNLNYSNSKNENNFENIINTKNNRRQKYNKNNNFVRSQYNNRNLKKINDVNNNCTVF